MVAINKALNFDAKEVNAAFDMTCEELKSKYARYPINYDRWLGCETECDGKPTFVAATADEGLKLDYVYCKQGPKGPGYYHLRTKISYVGLYSRLASSPPGGCCGGGDKGALAAWDTTKIVLHERMQYKTPNDNPAPVEVNMQKLAGAVAQSTRAAGKAF